MFFAISARLTLTVDREMEGMKMGGWSKPVGIQAHQTTSVRRSSTIDCWWKSATCDRLESSQVMHSFVTNGQRL